MIYTYYDVIILCTTIFEDIHATNSIEIVHATAQSPIIFLKNMILVHKQRIISANPNPIDAVCKGSGPTISEHKY